MAITNITEALEALRDLAKGLPEANENIDANAVIGGTFGGQVAAHVSYQAPATSLLRNSKVVSAETNPTANGEIIWVYS